jgi:hypothetical protein
LSESELIITPKIQTVDQAAKFTADFVNNPPQTPLDVVRVAASAFDVSGIVGRGLALAFPLVGSVLPALTGIFSLFGGSGPSIGEITLTAIAQVSKQIQKGFQAVTDTLSKVTEIQAQRTIETVLSGVTELAREQSAVEVYKTFSASAILEQVEAQKAEIFAEYTETLNAQRAAWVADIQKALSEAQAKTAAQYDIVQAQIAAIAGGVFREINTALQKAADDGRELLELQRQIDEINGYLADNSLPLLADQIVRAYFGIAIAS